jgi:hypothetical protein
MSTAKHSRRWYEKNKTRVRAYRNRRKKHFARITQERKDKHPEAFLLTWAKYRAKVDGLDFNIELSDIKIPKRCPVLGMVLKAGSRGNPTSPSLDRFKNELGYTKGNVFVISRRANVLKNNGTLKEFKSLVRYLTPKRKKKRGPYNTCDFCDVKGCKGGCGTYAEVGGLCDESLLLSL